MCLVNGQPFQYYLGSPYTGATRTILQIPQCTWPISHNAPFRTEMCTSLFWMVHCRIWTSALCGMWVHISWELVYIFNTLWSQDGRHFADEIFKYISCKQILFFIQMSLYLIPKGLIDKKPALVQIMNRRQAIIWTEMALFVDAY